MSKIYYFSGGCLKNAIACKCLSEAVETVSPLVLQKINADNFNQLDDYRVPFCEQYIYLQNAPEKTLQFYGGNITLNK